MSDRTGNSPSSRGPNKTMLRRTLFLLGACGIVAFLVLAGKLYEIMIIKHDLYESAAITQQVRETTVASARGTIYDTNGKIMAMSASVSTIVVVPAEIERSGDDPRLVAQGLSNILGLDYAKILDMTADTKSWYKIVARKVEDDLMEQVREFKSENKIAGIRIEPDYKRYYPYGSLGAHLIGFVGMENSGLSGIELKYNSDLSGTAGRVVRATNAAGTDLLYMNYEDYLDADNGYDVTMTMDSSIQFYVEKHLKQAIKDYEIQNGAAAIAMDVDTGAILAMASLGNFDLNDYQTISEEAEAYIEENAQTPEQASAWRTEQQQLQWRNKALSDTYEPGSTFKIITLSMALNENVVSENDSFYCGGRISVTGDAQGAYRSCWKTTGHGSQTLVQAVQHSCNVAFIQIGLKVGAEKFYEYAEAFGFMNRPQNKDATPSSVTGIDLSGESGSIWWPENAFTAPYDKTSLAAASFGQTFTITPLQLITAVSACVNGGNLMKPYVVKEIRASDGSVVTATEPTVVRRVVSEDTSAKVCQILERVVGDPVEGTGKNAYVAGYRIGGKTGTSEKVAQNLQTGTKEYIVSFIGVAPADDPKIAILVLLDNPLQPSKTYTSGGQMVAPVVGKMMADILPYMGVEPEYTDSEKQNMDKSMPNVTDLSVAEAQSALAAEGFTCRVIGDGAMITKQLPAANTVIASGSEVLIYAGAEPSEELEEMLDLKDLTYSVARQRLGWIGIFIKSDSSVTNAETQLITAQSIEVGEKIEHGTVVQVSLVAGGDAMLGRY